MNAPMDINLVFRDSNVLAQDLVTTQHRRRLLILVRPPFQFLSRGRELRRHCKESKGVPLNRLGVRKNNHFSWDNLSFSSLAVGSF